MEAVPLVRDPALLETPDGYESEPGTDIEWVRACERSTARIN